MCFPVISISFLTSVCLAPERYISVIHPFVYSIKATQRKAVGAIALIWLINCACVLPSFVSKTSTVLHIAAGSTITFFEIVCVICYSRVYLVTRRIRRQIRMEEKRFHTVPAVPERKTESKLMLSTCSIVLSFVCSYFLFQVSSLFKLTKTHRNFSCFCTGHGQLRIQMLCRDQSFDTCWQLSAIWKGVLSLWEKKGKTQYQNGQS